MEQENNTEAAPQENVSGLDSLLSGETQSEVVSDTETASAEVDNTQETEDTTSTLQEGERPEWLPEKFESAEKMAESYKNLESKFGNFTGAPEEYEIVKPEGVDFEFYEDAEYGVDQFQGMAREMGLDQDGFNKVMNFYIQSESQRVGMEMQAREDSVYEVFGGQEKAQKEIPQISARVKGSIGEEGMKVYQDAASGSSTSAASAIKLAGMLINKLDGEFTQSHKPATPASQVSRDGLREMMKDPRYKTSAEYRAEVDAGYTKLFNK